MSRSMPRYAARRDTNDPDIVKAARRMGWFMVKLDTPCDYLGGFRGQWYAVEIKDPKKEGHADEFTQPQREFMAECFQRTLPVLVWRIVEDIAAHARA